MENVEEKPKVDIDAMCRMCHHQFDADKSVKIFDDELTASLPISVQIKIFTGVEVSVFFIFFFWIASSNWQSDK